MSSSRTYLTPFREVRPGTIRTAPVTAALYSDYETPRQAGYQSLLLRHQSADEEHNNPSYVDEIDGRRTDVYAVRDLTEVIAWLEKESGRT